MTRASAGGSYARYTGAYAPVSGSSALKPDTYAFDGGSIAIPVRRRRRGETVSAPYQDERELPLSRMMSIDRCDLLRYPLGPAAVPQVLIPYKRGVSPKVFFTTLGVLFSVLCIMLLMSYGKVTLLQKEENAVRARIADTIKDNIDLSAEAEKLLNQDTVVTHAVRYLGMISGAGANTIPVAALECPDTVSDSYASAPPKREGFWNAIFFFLD